MSMQFCYSAGVGWLKNLQSNLILTRCWSIISIVGYFAALSWTKFLSFDLVPASYRKCDDRYIFPFELLDSESLTRLQHIQLGFVCLRPPNQFRGFPNLKMLDLHAVCANGKDSQAMLSSCCSLEWLSLVGCLLDDVLKADHPLPCLQYLSVANCGNGIHKIELDCMKLSTFIYEGFMVPIDLSKAFKLDKVDVHFYITTLEHVITTFPNALPNMQNMTLCGSFKPPEMSYFIESPCKFTHLKHLRLLSFLNRDVDTMSLVSFLRAAPFVEKLEIQVIFCSSFTSNHFMYLIYFYMLSTILLQWAWWFF
ncbi:hypothetical protein PR202_gb21582 [Eleusine coracana subsp. coracana]|uniref:At1g61320/AtMIF1 LRR domain-containing protein n=1 Tax=Eleusine coracana subsp. coracana TaxID=191504 RepID=A0AAV5FF44_ELECO|nr:hypothetical protein PR202_gb21582 [Eleusine coracana subsp. coracana]